MSEVLALNEAVKKAAEHIVKVCAVHRDFVDDLVAALNNLYVQAYDAAAEE